ncbi:MAG: zinc-ribbon domain-containing protein [Clostridia bacterium]
MEIYEIKNKVTETAKNVMKKSNEIIEVTKLNMSIGDAQTRIDSLLKEIGQIIYDAYQDGDIFADELMDKCKQAEEEFEKVREIKEKVAQFKKVKLCPRCDKENNIDAAYCSKCGFRIEDEELDEE